MGIISILVSLSYIMQIFVLDCGEKEMGVIGRNELERLYKMICYNSSRSKNL